MCINTMKNYLVSLALLLSPAFASAQEPEPETDLSTLVINEVQVANIDQFLDNSLCYGGWIEFYNPTAESIPLKGMYLSDGVNEYHFNSLSVWGSVPAQGFKVLYFGHSQAEGNYGAGAKKQIPFKLEQEGGTISLLNSEREVVASADYPPSIVRCSWGRKQDGASTWEYTGEPTPGASNNNSDFAEFRLEEPTVTVDSKVFTQSFWTRVPIPSGYKLRYTLDGSAPTATNGTTSTSGLFEITSTTILRLCFLKKGMLPSPVVTRSYIYQNHEYYLPILSVVSEDKHFFDNQIGVFIRGTNGISGNGQSSPCNWNMDWERPVNMEYLVPRSTENGLETTEDGCTSYSMVLNQEMDLEICGGWTRAYGGATVDDRYWEARSSFRLKTDKRYEGVNSIDYPVFPLKPYNKYRSWQVRNGGNDTYARSKDPGVQMMVLKSGFYVDGQDYQPAHVFLNGLYYGMLNIRESNNKHFAYSNYGIDFDDMDQFDLSNAQYNQKVGDNQAWMQLQRLAATLGRTKSEETYRQICDLLDMDEYVNYMALECYMGPTDWITNTNNIKGFRSRSDGKFHFVLFDCDSAFGTTNMLTDVLSTSGGVNVDDLFRNLMKYDPFRRQFMDAFCIVDGSVFEPTRCEEIVWDIYSNTTPALLWEGRTAGTGLAGSVRSAHNGSRITNMRNYFGVNYGIFANLSSNIPEAQIAVNGQEFPTGKFHGYLFSYNGLPIQLSAKAPAGYTFRGWESESSETITSTLVPEGSNWMYYDRGSMDNYDWKAPSFDESASGWRSGTAPFGFANSGYYMQDNSVTKLDKGSGTRRSTYYFRKTFQLEAPLSDEDILTFHYQVDDGIMLYVNGHEVGGYYIASGSTYSDYTIDQHHESQDPYLGSFDIPHEYLRVGENQIALEVKNCHGTSSDIWFEGSLSLTSKERQMVSESDVVDLHEILDNNSNVNLSAVFVPITDEQQRWAAGASPLRINEVSASGDIYINDYGKRADWLELYNTTDHDISLAGLYLSDNPSSPQKYQLQEGFVPAHGTRIIWCDKKDGIDQLHAPFKLENADGAKVCIQAEDGSWADQLEYREHDKWQTFGRYPDGANMSTVLNQPTIDKSNKLGMFDFNALTEDDWLGHDRTITLDLAEGWNWTSHNFAESVDKSRFLMNALQLQGQTESLLWAEEEGWQGTLHALEAAKGYKIKMQREGSVTLRGPLYDVNIPVALQAGWNWIGCPLYNATTLEAALAGYVPNEGDKLVGLDAFATYENGAWFGSLKSLQPGQSYLFYTSQAQEFCWQSLSPQGARKRRYAPARPAQDELLSLQSSTFNLQSSIFNVDIHSYPDVMTMVATVEADDGISLDEPYYVGAFCGDTCRGIGVMDAGLLYMNIHGEVTGDNIVFRLLDAEGEVYGSLGYVAFQACKQLGTVQKPYRLWFASQEVIDEIKPAFASSGKVKRTEYYNLAGQMVDSKWRDGKCVIRKVIYEDGSMKVTKLYR